MPAIEVAVLGPVRVLVDGEPVALPSVQQRVLLACLALAPGRPVSASQLIDALWPTGAPANAQGNLQSYISRLRKVVGADRLVHEPGGYRLAVEPVDVDIGAAEALVAESRALTADDPAGAAGRLDDAVALWRGDPLVDLPERLAFAPDLAHLDAWRRQLIEDRAALRLAAGDAAAAIPDLERAVAADPLRERAVALLMRALHDAGRTPDALAAASSYRHRLADETGLDPGHELRELERRILTDDPQLRSAPRGPAATSPSRPVRTVHAPADRFVGRDEDLRRIRDAVAGYRLVTVVGPGGIGKTRLVLEFLTGDDGPDDQAVGGASAVVELAAVAASDEVPATTAAALGLTSAPTGTVDALVDRLSGGPFLVVLDNCEHVRDGAAQLAATLLARCPELRLLATSRRRLDVAGERLVRLAPLATDAQVDLFCDRAAMLRPDFDDSADARRVVADICRQLDGLPLAVELAAQREPVFGLRQLRDGLAVGLDMLDPVGRGDRTDGIAPTVEWSYRLLDASARALFDRLTICAEGFTLDALTDFAPEGGPAQVPLAELVDASMVLADHAQDPPRYRILEPIRQLGDHHLDGPGRLAAETAHTAWMRRHVAIARRAQDRRSSAAGRLLLRERANLRQALRRSVERAAWDDAAALGVDTAMLVVDHPLLDLLEQLTLLDRVTDHHDVADETRARCLVAAGTARWLRGQADVGVAHCSAAVEVLPDAWIPVFLRAMGRLFLGDVEGIDADARTVLAHADAPTWVRATVVCLAALVHEFSGGHDTATGWFAEHTDLLTVAGAADGFVSYTRGELIAAEDPEGALDAFERAEARCRDAGVEYDLRVTQVARAAVLIRLGNHAAAISACVEALIGLRDAGMWPQIWMLLRLIAELLVERGEPSTALALLDAADDDPLAPPVLDADRARIAHLREVAVGAGDAVVGDVVADGDAAADLSVIGAGAVRVTNRAAAVRMALDALARHR